jgi:hypothetical protein
VKVLVACECSGIVRDAFRALGHDAWSCDLQECERDSAYHLQMDARLALRFNKWDLLIAHPPCTYLCHSGFRWYFGTPKNPGPGVPYGSARFKALKQGVEFFKFFLSADVPRIAIENPIMHPLARDMIGVKYNCKIQPHEFFDKQKKATCLWLKNLPPLMPETYYQLPKGDTEENKQWQACHNYFGSDHAKERSRTYQGIANAMAKQWGCL